MIKLIGLLLSLGLIGGSIWAGPIEDWVETSADPEGLQEWLDELRLHPLDLNSASALELAGLPFVDSAVARRIVAARKASGGFQNLGQVLALPRLTIAQREALEELAVVRTPPEKALIRAVHQAEAKTLRSRLRGDFSYNDVARAYVSVNERPGVSDVSAGLEFKSWKSPVRVLAGDYQAEWGTGLVVSSAYGMANWLSSATAIEPNALRGLKSKPTGDGRARLRGAAVEATHRVWNTAVFASVQALDAERANGKVRRITEGETASGPLAIARDRQLEERLAGAVFGLSLGAVQTGLCAIHSRYSEALEPDDPTQFAGGRFTVGAIFVRSRLGRVSLLVEAAKSDPGRFAHQSAVSLRGERMAVSTYNVFAANDFYSPHSKMWGGYGVEASNYRRTGCKLQVMWPREVTTVHVWSSVNPLGSSHFPLRRNASGIDMQSASELGEGVSLTATVEREWREEMELERTHLLEMSRLRVETVWRGRYELKVRAEFKSAGTEGSPDHATGTLLFVQARHEYKRTSLFLRVTVFSAENGTVAARTFENSPDGVFPLVILSGNGRRVAVMARRDLGGMTGSLKVAHTITESPKRATDVDAILQISFRW